MWEATVCAAGSFLDRMITHRDRDEAEIQRFRFAPVARE
jgi:hypothetical protein